MTKKNQETKEPRIKKITEMMTHQENQDYAIFRN